MTLYLDNSATSFPKPESVYQALDHFARHIGASAGRGNYAEAAMTGDLIAECRVKLARFFNASDPQRFIFGLNCTDALNLAIKGTLHPGGHAITTWMDHNSVLRPLREMEERGIITVSRVPCNGYGFVNPEDIRRAIRPETQLIAVVHGSNVTGTVQPAAEIGRIARESRIPWLLDIAQSAGHYPIDFQSDLIDMAAFPGHKGLLGTLGTGALYVRPGLELALVREGGTGSRSELDVQPDFWPDRHEAGSHNAHGIAGLSAGLDYLLEHGIDAIRRNDAAIIRTFLGAVRDLEGINVYGPPSEEGRMSVFSLRIAGWEPIDLAKALDVEFGIKCRAGLHCAPLAHKTIGTFPEGTTRFSFGHFNSPEDALTLADALGKLAVRNAAGVK